MRVKGTHRDRTIWPACGHDDRQPKVEDEDIFVVLKNINNNKKGKSGIWKTYMGFPKHVRDKNFCDDKQGFS
jgi:hypothetical protein